MTAATDIEAAYQRLKSGGFDLGPATPAGVVSAFAGGAMRAHVNGNIYWHANAGAHEVHGGILSEYLAGGGPGEVAPGVRLFGYPVSDEEPRRDGRYVISRFEFGAIYWSTGRGAVPMTGDIWTAYCSQTPGAVPLGGPLAPVEQAGLGNTIDVQFFDHGCIVRRNSRTSVCTALTWPRVGKPRITDLRSAIPDLFSFGHDSNLLDPLLPSTLRQGNTPAIVTLWGDRLGLRPVGGGTTVRLHLSERAVTTSVATTHRLDATPGQALTDATLYDLVFRTITGSEIVVAPHAIYAKASWTRFGFMHITDMHVAGRNDWMHADANANGFGHTFVNFNDGFREAILVANNLHAAGKCDVVLATGDLVDFAYEDGDDPSGGGNFDRLVDIVRGDSPSPSGLAAQPLTVPIFMVPGNHDYRPLSYPLRFKVSVGPIGHTFGHHECFNLTKAQADVLQDLETGRARSRFHQSVQALGSMRELTTSAAAALVAPATPTWLLNEVIGLQAQGCYDVHLGPHRLVMLDTGHDVGVVSGVLDVVSDYLGFNSENERTFMGGDPNQQGVTSTHIGRLNQAITDAGTNGVVLVGMHGPPLNPAGNEYPHYFRETEHPSAPDIEMQGYLFRRVPAGSFVLGSESDVNASMWPEWSRTGSSWFKRGSTNDLLDHGVARGPIDGFLDAVAGRNRPRPVDLVLCGHGHRRVEYRIGIDSTTGDRTYSTDFYFDQPDRYYASRKVGHPDPVNIRVVAGATPNGTPQSIRDHRVGPQPVQYEELEVPPRRSTLENAPNPRSWWLRHRPFVVQTAATGPLEFRQIQDGAVKRPEPTFRGVRIGIVDGPAVVEFKSVTLAEARRLSYTLALTPFAPPQRPNRRVTAAL
jgi:hypothetical protein